MNRFPHHKLIVYRRAVELAVAGKELADRVPRGYRNLADQLLRAAPSVALLVAEGANRWTAGHKRLRFVEARGECGEAAAAVEVLQEMGLLPPAECERFLAAADEVAAMLTGLIRRHS